MQVVLSEFGQSSFTGALLMVRLSTATFLITFGQGRYLMSDTAYERDFGLRVALNAINPVDIRSIDRVYLHEQTPLNSRIQPGKGVEIFDLHIDPEMDLLSAVTGATKNKPVGVQLKEVLVLKPERLNPNYIFLNLYMK
ncbi:MAG: TIGR04141 family sporadically distributed protein [Amphritea sp.]